MSCLVHDLESSYFEYKADNCFGLMAVACLVYCSYFVTVSILAAHSQGASGAGILT